MKFGKLIDATWAAQITANEKLVLLALLWHYRPGGEIRPSLERLCAMTGQSQSTLQRALKALQKRGFISVIRRGKKLANVYQINHAKVIGQDDHSFHNESGEVSGQYEQSVNGQIGQSDWSNQGEVNGQIDRSIRTSIEHTKNTPQSPQGGRVVLKSLISDLSTLTQPEPLINSKIWHQWLHGFHWCFLVIAIKEVTDDFKFGLKFAPMQEFIDETDSIRGVKKRLKPIDQEELKQMHEQVQAAIERQQQANLGR